MHLDDHTIDQRHKALAVLISALDDFIVDVGNITHVFQFVPQETQVARNHIEGNKGTSMANVTEIVNRNTTHVHADFPGMDRFKFLFLARHCIKDF